ncbi:MAG: tyrosine-type recombinase/integrase [Eubacteriales bacterium]|nr:tyrosine-type recombinase/integrase [Eubacteriales bacterium]
MKKEPTTIFERGSWYYRYEILNENLEKKYRKKGGFKTQEEATQAFTNYQKELQKRKQSLTLRQRNTMLFSNYLKKWFEGRESIEGSTRMVYEYVMQLILPNLKDVRLGAVNAEFIRAQIVWISRRTPSYGEKLYELFSMALGDAFYKEKIPYNPMTGVQKPSRLKTRIVFLTSEQKKLLYQSVRNNDWCLEFLMALLCGLRKGEIHGLKFSDFDSDKKTVHVQRQVVNDFQIVDGKRIQVRAEKPLGALTGDRILSVPQIVLDELNRRKDKIAYEKVLCKEKYQDRGYLCCQKDGQCRGHASLNNELTKLCNRAGLPHLSPEDLRDLYATAMLQEEGVSFVILKGLLGYTTVEEAYERYCDLAEENTNLVGVMEQTIQLNEKGDSNY